MFYRSEICPKANAVTKWRHGNKLIKNLGDIRLINEEIICAEIMKNHHVDFLIGTPPCNDFSRANPYRKGLDGNLMKQYNKNFYDQSISHRHVSLKEKDPQ